MQCTVCLQSCSRSAKFIIHHSSTARGLTYGQSESEKDWKSIWKVNAPWKMKIHLWRFAHNCLPSEVQLVRRHIPVDAILSVGVLRKSSFPCISSGKFSFHASSGCSTSLLDHPCSRLLHWLWCFGIYGRHETRNSESKPKSSPTIGKKIAYIDLIRQHLFKPGQKQRWVHNASSSLDFGPHHRRTRSYWIRMQPSSELRDAWLQVRGHLKRADESCRCKRRILFDVLWLAMASIWSTLAIRPSEN
jgi:hypothetical protein